MPKNEVKTVPIDKKVFMDVLNRKGKSIRKLGAICDIEMPSEKTIRRQLNKGRMREKYIESIAKYINVDKSVLTGEIINLSIGKNFYPLNHLDEFPYSLCECKSLYNEDHKELFKRILATFNRTYQQFEKLSFEGQYEFMKKCLDALYPIVINTFETDVSGIKNNIEDQRIFAELEIYKDDYYIKYEE